MTPSLQALVREAQATGTLRGLPEHHFIGQVFINEYFAGGISVPFGGNKRSGFGREKGLEALRSYCNIKSVAARI